MKSAEKSLNCSNNSIFSKWSEILTGQSSRSGLEVVSNFRALDSLAGYFARGWGLDLNSALRQGISLYALASYTHIYIQGFVELKSLYYNSVMLDTVLLQNTI